MKGLYTEMKKRKKKIPKFNSIAEEAHFWDTHDTTDYMDEMEIVDVKVNFIPETEKKETISLRMAPSLKKEVDKIARNYDISTSSLIRMWVVDKVTSYRS